MNTTAEASKMKLCQLRDIFVIQVWRLDTKILIQKFFKFVDFW